MRMLSSLCLKIYRPDLIWISSPELFTYLPKNITTSIIYDCMDDALAFSSDKQKNKCLGLIEQTLIKKSKHVFCSSEHLLKKLQMRHGYEEKYSILHNAFSPSILNTKFLQKRSKAYQKIFKLGYVGTLSHWFDFDAITKIVETYPQIEIHLIGPLENLNAFPLKQDRIKYIGPIPHDKIYNYVHKYDAFLMPFKDSDLIRSVDPVKLYEYVFFNKPIFCIHYKEIEKFKDFVDFYSNHNNLLKILKYYLSVNFKNKYSENQRLEFIKNHSWDVRLKGLSNEIKNYI
jgi:hypothetical protein